MRDQPKPSARPTLIWEGVLLAGTLVVLVGLAGLTSELRSGRSLELLAFTTAIVLLHAVAIQLGVQVRAPFLASSAIGSVSGAMLAWSTTSQDWPWPVGVVAGLLAALVVGMVLAVLVVVLKVPGWAATLGAQLLLSAITLGLIGPRGLAQVDGPKPGGKGVVFVLACGVAVAAALAGRATAGRRSENEAPGSVAVAAAMVSASLIGGVAGLLLALQFGGASQFRADYELLAALAIVGLSGLSLRGWRPPLIGVIVAAVLLEVTNFAMAVRDWAPGWQRAVYGVAGIFGLAIGAILDRSLERPRGPALAAPAPLGPPSGPWPPPGVPQPPVVPQPPLAPQPTPAPQAQHGEPTRPFDVADRGQQTIIARPPEPPPQHWGDTPPPNA